MRWERFHRIIVESVWGLPRTTCSSLDLGCPGVTCWWWTPVPSLFLPVCTVARGRRAEPRVSGCFGPSTLILPSLSVFPLRKEAQGGTDVDDTLLTVSVIKTVQSSQLKRSPPPGEKEQSRRPVLGIHRDLRTSPDSHCPVPSTAHSLPMSGGS